MGKNLYIAEKPSVALEFARVLKVNGQRKDGYVESEDSVVTWCVGHLISMSYPEKYDAALKKWSFQTIPFMPDEWKYEVIDSVKKQFSIVKGLLTRKDVDTIYVCTDSGREGEYIYRLVRQEAGVTGKQEKRVWIDSQTEEEILRGIREAKDLSCYDNLAASAYLRAKEDYLMGINFSRVLSLKFGQVIADTLHTRYTSVSVGRVMTCVLGMVVRREREIRAFVPTPFYRVIGSFTHEGGVLDGEWKAVQGSKYFESPYLYKENGFKTRDRAEELISYLQTAEEPARVLSVERKRENKKPPLLFNLAELQNECSKRFKKSPDETLQIVQALYEKKLVTYPRTDARVLSTAVAKVIRNNIYGLTNVEALKPYASEILDNQAYAGIEKSQYTDDKKITDHYAIIPTGQGIRELSSVSPLHRQVYELIARRFLCIFYPPAVYEKASIETGIMTEHFFSNFRFLKKEGYLKVWKSGKETDQGDTVKAQNLEMIEKLKKGDLFSDVSYDIKEGETSAPKRYSSGSLILAMENAGQLIEDEDLRAQIKGSGIGTSATRAEILKKLDHIQYIRINPKTQIVTPCLQGELTYDVVEASMKQLLNPELTASWEKGLSYVAEGSITEEEYMEKLKNFVRIRTERVKQVQNPSLIRTRFGQILEYYPAAGKKK